MEYRPLKITVVSVEDLVEVYVVNNISSQRASRCGKRKSAQFAGYQRAMSCSHRAPCVSMHTHQGNLRLCIQEVEFHPFFALNCVMAHGRKKSTLKINEQYTTIRYKNWLGSSISGKMASRRELKIMVISAKDLKKVNPKTAVYATGTLVADLQTKLQKTSVDKGANPTWFSPMTFHIDEAAARLGEALHFKIMCEQILSDKMVGKVCVSIKELLDKIGHGEPVKFVSYPVEKPSGKFQGQLNLSYELGQVIGAQMAVETVTGYSAPMSTSALNYTHPGLSGVVRYSLPQPRPYTPPLVGYGTVVPPLGYGYHALPYTHPGFIGAASYAPSPPGPFPPVPGYPLPAVGFGPGYGRPPVQPPEFIDGFLRGSMVGNMLSNQIDLSSLGDTLSNQIDLSSILGGF